MARALSIALVVVSVVAASARAAENPATGTWEWTYNTKDPNDPKKAVVATVAVKLVQDGEKLTGVFVERGGGEAPVTDGKIAADGTLSFTVTRQIAGEQRVFKYRGKLEKDTITGKIDFIKGDKVSPRDWEAKRQ
ncbi:MAG TPA: hypothetical protein VEA69_24480 [Tepidisphaeraceae bacterium]|nr:hypothetical protein [Tepidisphaeraceae bacterium]